MMLMADKNAGLSQLGSFAGYRTIRGFTRSAPAPASASKGSRGFESGTPKMA